MTINFDDLIIDFSKINIQAKKNGLISDFGVLSVLLPTNFYNIFSLRLIQSIINSDCKTISYEKSVILSDYAAGLLENAAAECGYYTGCGIINSEEFSYIMNDKVKNPDDILQGLFALVVSLGWGDIKIAELIPNEKLVIRVYDYYESDIKDIIKITRPFAFMLSGISRAFMDIVFGEKFPPHRFGKFKCVQTKGLEIGDDYGEFVVTRDSI